MTNLNVNELVARLANINAPSFKDTLTGCRVAGFGPLQCAPVAYRQFPSTSAIDVAKIIVNVWPCLYTTSLLTQALGACQRPGTQTSAFDSATISSAVSQAVTATLCGSATTPDFFHELGLFQGDITRMKAGAEHVDYLIVSCLPNDYQPTRGSVIAALQTLGVNMAAIAQNKAADYRSTHHCWISQPIGNQFFSRLVVFESTGSAAPNAIPGVFTAIREFQPSLPPTPAAGAIVASTMLSTGSAGASTQAVLTSLFTGALSSVRSGANLLGVRMVVYPSAWDNSMATLFTQLKQQHGLL